MKNTKIEVRQMETSKIRFINEKLRIKYANKRFCHKRSPLDCFKQSCLGTRTRAMGSQSLMTPLNNADYRRSPKSMLLKFFMVTCALNNTSSCDSCNQLSTVEPRLNKIKGTD